MDIVGKLLIGFIVGPLIGFGVMALVCAPISFAITYPEEKRKADEAKRKAEAEATKTTTNT